MGFIAKDGLSLLGEYSYTSNTLKLNLRYIWKLCIHVYRVSNSELTLLYALVCKGDASHIKISLIIMKTRPETNCWLWLKTENIFSKKLQIFVFFLIGFIYPKSCPTFCLMSYYNYYKGKKYAICILHTLCIPRYNFKKNNYFLCPQKYDYLVNDSLRNPNTEIPKKNWTRFLMSINN